MSRTKSKEGQVKDNAIIRRKHSKASSLIFFYVPSLVMSAAPLYFCPSSFFFLILLLLTELRLGLDSGLFMCPIVFPFFFEFLFADVVFGIFLFYTVIDRHSCLMFASTSLSNLQSVLQCNLCLGFGVLHFEEFERNCGS